MSQIRINDKLPRFSAEAKAVLDDALKEGAKDGLINAKMKAPFDKGQLRAESDIKKMGSLTWRISFWKEYARFQEFGGDAKRRVRNYTTAGTGRAFLKKAGDDEAKKIVAKFKKHSSRVRV